MVAIQDEWSFPYSNAIPTLSEDHHHVCLFFTAPLEAKPLTIEIHASNGASDQVRRAGDHGIHALLCAAHPERRHPEWRPPKRRAPRVPEADAVLGRRGPAGRPAPAQGAAGEGHGGGEGGRSCLPHRYTASLYHIALPHRYTTSLYHIAIPYRSTASLYHIAIPHRYTTSASAVACRTR